LRYYEIAIDKIFDVFKIYRHVQEELKGDKSGNDYRISEISNCDTKENKAETGDQTRPEITGISIRE